MFKPIYIAALDIALARPSSEVVVDLERRMEEVQS